MSLRKMATLAGVDPGTVSRIETGRLIPYDRDLVRLAGALGWPSDQADALLEDVGTDA